MKDETPMIRTPRQARFIKALQQAPCSTRELMDKVGARNVWDVCRQLRGNGWKIETYSEPYTDQDGHRSSIGYYRLLEEPQTTQAALSHWNHKETGQ